MVSYLLFFAGFVLLVSGAGWLVDGAASLAKRHRISNLVIGMTIVALGTSAPELVVNLVASFRETADVAMGNILGSNVSNIFLILGVSALVFPLAVERNTLWMEVPYALMGALLIGLLANDLLWSSSGTTVVGRIDGIVLMVFFLLFMGYAFGISGSRGLAEVEVRQYPKWLSWMMVLTGMLALVAGGRWIVDGAVAIASQLGMSEAVISLSMVALGTSLPELATCVAAARKRNAGIVIGNILGSNVFNIFFVLGVSALIKPLPFNPVMNFDVLTGILAMVLLWVFLMASRSRTLGRWQGGALVTGYLVYLTLLFS